MDEAVARANATPYGVNVSVWTRDGARGRAVAARVHAGTVNVNAAFAATWGSIFPQRWSRDARPEAFAASALPCADRRSAPYRPRPVGL